MTFQEECKNMIKNTHLLQNDIARKAGVHPVLITKIQRRVENMSMYTVSAICKACGYRLELVKEESDEHTE